MSKQLKKMNIEFKKAKERAEQSDMLKSKFVANLSHEIRTPMNGILGFAELLEDTTLDTKKQADYLKIIQENGLRMLNLLNDLIDISKIETGQISIIKRETNFNSIVEESYKSFMPLAQKKGIELKHDCQFTDEKITTDKYRLQQVISNLLSNAIKFTEQGEIKLVCTKENNNLVIKVRDTGIGISEEMQTKIFERFWQVDGSNCNQSTGSGLGLFISKSIVEMLDGEMGVHSEIKKGAEFYFKIPLQDRK